MHVLHVLTEVVIGGALVAVAYAARALGAEFWAATAPQPGDEL